jgi:hypothetical protein
MDTPDANSNFYLTAGMQTSRGTDLVKPGPKDKDDQMMNFDRND